VCVFIVCVYGVCGVCEWCVSGVCRCVWLTEEKEYFETKKMH